MGKCSISHKIHTLVSCFLACFFLLLSCGPDLPPAIEEALATLPDQIDYNEHVRPILSDRCFSCHGPDQNKLEAGLRLDVAEMALAELPDNAGHRAIVPKNLSKSELVHRILSADSEIMMPPPESKLRLSDREKATLLQWIREGAEYKEHWAFIPPTHASIPTVSHKEWPNSELDFFVLGKLEKLNLKPQDEAEKELLIRRVSLDLTGLPPSLQEIDNYINDLSEDAFENVVDRLLASPHYGEHMAVDWLDLARYADTHGYSVDRYRDMSPWRDWVIKALNQNMPYDQFVEWQIAGDLLPDPSREQILATGFNRNHAQNMEGGIVPEEFRIEYVSDRTNTFGKAFLGLTLECARCHDHKYDPISQAEYFQLFAYFNNVNESGQISWNNATPVPTLLMTDDRVEEITSYLDTQIDSLEQISEQLPVGDEGTFEQWFASKPTLPRVALNTVALFDFEKLYQNAFQNQIARRSIATSINTVSKKQYPPDLVSGYTGNGILLNGDEAIELGQIGNSDRHQPFTVSLWIKLPKTLHDGVIFHKGIGAVLYNFRGYHLALKDDRLELMMAHTAPHNAIIEYALEPVARDRWVHLAMTYDGSSAAAGLKVFVDGTEQATEVSIDNLFKTIHFNEKVEPGIKIGARWRGVGIKGAQVDDFMVHSRALYPVEIDKLAGGHRMHDLIHGSSYLSADDRQELQRYHRDVVRKVTHQTHRTLTAIRAERNQALDTVGEVMVMEEMANPRPTFVLNRGAYDAPGAAVDPSTPAKLPSQSSDAEPNRLSLAKWLMRSDHPLTARVAVNRYWQRYFGQGLVKTADDFGSQGSLPSHLDLLDFMSLSFIESGWDIKELQKLIVMSATYRQASFADAKLQKRDPENILLARGPRVRLRGEMIRDHALASCGLLNRTLGGKSVKPYQPKGLWKMNGSEYKRDTGTALYRRSLYTMWKRTIPHPTLSTFDVPSRANCEVKRQKTSTPLQALVLLNDPTYIECSRAMAAQMTLSPNAQGAITFAFRSLTGRFPTDGELELLLAQQEEELAKFDLTPEKMTGWMSMGEYQSNDVQLSSKVAAYAVVASTIMNSDAFIYKR